MVIVCLERVSLIEAYLAILQVELSQCLLRGKTPALSRKSPLIVPCPIAFPKTFKSERGVLVAGLWKEQNL